MDSIAEKDHLQELLLNVFRRPEVYEVVDWVQEKPHRIVILMEFCLGELYLESNRAVRVGRILQEREPAFCLPYVGEILEKYDTLPHPGTRREVIRMIRDLPVWPPESMMGGIADLAFKAMENPAEPHGVRVYAMDIAERICGIYPEMAPEYESILKRFIPESGTWFRIRAKRWIENQHKKAKKQRSK